MAIGDPIPGMCFSDAFGWYWPDNREMFGDRLSELEAARAEIAKLKAERLKLQRRIHNQRKALRVNWQIVEARGKWLGSPDTRRRYVSLLKRYHALLAQTAVKAGHRAEVREDDKRQ